MIATRMVVFESTEQPLDNSPKPIRKAVSMRNLMGVAGGSQATPIESKPVPSGSMMCNPSTGQAVLLPRVLSSSSLLNCIRATTQGPSPKPRPQHTPSPLTSDSDYSSGSSHPTPPCDGDPSELPLDPPQMSPTTSPQMSPTTGMAPQRGRAAVGALKQLFEITSPHQTSLFRATSLPTLLHHSPQAPEHRRPHPPPLVVNAPPPSKVSPTRQAGKGKVPLLPPVKRVQFHEPSGHQQSSSDHYSNQHSSNVGAHKKIPLLPPSSWRPPTTSSPPTPPSSSWPPTTPSPPPPPSNIPPPKPPRAAHRLRLAQVGCDKW